MSKARTNVNIRLTKREPRLMMVQTGRQVRALIDAARKSRGEEPEFASEPVSDFALQELHRCLDFIQEVQRRKEHPSKTKGDADGDS